MSIKRLWRELALNKKP